jgi:hypothetical protein
LNEFAVLVGETSLSRKGTAWAAVRNLLEAVDDDWSRTRVRGGFPSGESIIHAVRDPATYRIGKCKALDPGVADKRLLMYEPEFARFLENCSRQKSTLSSVTVTFGIVIDHVEKALFPLHARSARQIREGRRRASRARDLNSCPSVREHLRQLNSRESGLSTI